MPTGRCGSASSTPRVVTTALFTVAVFMEYLALVVVVILIAYVVLQILGTVQGAFYRGPQRSLVSKPSRHRGRRGRVVSLLGWSTRRGALDPAPRDPAVARYREHE
jgi:hypothetical protein